MERANSENENGGVKLPIGFRFHPTDEELLVHYLKRKVFSLPLPATVIPDFDVFQTNPWDLPGDLKGKRYFFSKSRTNVVHKCSSSFSSGCGYWKSTGKDKQIVAPGTNLLIGIRKSLVFYKWENSRGIKTQWIMQQFCLVGSINYPYLTQKLMMQVGDWVVCRLYQRKKKARKNLGRIKGSDCKNLSEISFAAQDSECSSGITEISSNDLDQEASSHSVRF